MKALKAKGLIKIENFKKNKSKLNYLYVITPKGIAEKTKWLVRFMKRKMNEYDELKNEYEKEKNKIDLNMITYSRQSINKTDINAVNKVLKSKFLTQGPEQIKFEKNS